MMSLALISQTDVGPRTPTHVVELAGLTTAPGRSMLSDFEQHLGGKGGSAIKPKFERERVIVYSHHSEQNGEHNVTNCSHLLSSATPSSVHSQLKL
jgi:hypothetical protein